MKHIDRVRRAFCEFHKRINLLMFLVLLSTLTFGQTLPQVVDNSKWFPPVRSQEVIANCTHFSLIYYLKSAIWNKRFNRDPKLDENQFNENFVWNQNIHPVYKNSDQPNAFYFMRSQGCATVSDFSINEQSDAVQPDIKTREKALAYKSKRLFQGAFFGNRDGNKDVSQHILDLKDSLVQGKCFSLDIPIFDYFSKMTDTKNVYNCYPDIKYDSVAYYHAFTIVGYNDTIKTAQGRGAFQVINSNKKIASGRLYMSYNWFYMANWYPYGYYFLEEDFSTQPRISLNLDLSGGISGKDLFDFNYLFVDTLFSYLGKKFDIVESINYFCNQNQVQVINVNNRKIKMRSKSITKPLNNLDGSYELISDLSDLTSVSDFKSASVVVFDPISANYLGADGQSFYAYSRESKLVINKAYLSFVGTDKKIVAKIKDLPDTTIITTDFYSVVAGLNLKPFKEQIYVKSCTSVLKRKLITFSIADARTDTPPVFTKVPSSISSVSVGSEFKFQFAVTDPEGAPTVYSIISGAGASINSVSGLFSYKASQIGDFSFTVKNSDGVYDIVNTFTVKVLVNQAPVFTTKPSTIVTEVNKSVNFKFIAQDPEGNLVTYSIVYGSGALINSATGDFNYPARQVGDFHFILAVSDGIESTTFSLFITVNPRANTDPYLTEHPGILSTEAGSTLNYQIKAADKENDKINFSLKSPVVGATLSSDGLLFFKADLVGVYPVTIIADDGFGGKIAFNIDVIVSPKVNKAPTFVAPLGTLMAYTNKVFNYQFEANDLDGDPLTFSILNSIPEAQISSSGNLTFNSAKVNTYRFTVVVSDGKALTNLDVAVQVDFNVDVEEIEAMNNTLKTYPNPFTDNTTIEFSLPKRQYVKLFIFNSLGQQIAVLANSEFEAGTHKLVFDGKGLPDGIFIGSLQIPNGSKTIKLIKSSGWN